MQVQLDKSFDSNLKNAGLTESAVIKAIMKLDSSKSGGVRGGDDDEPVPLTNSEKLAIAKAAIISAVAKLARPSAAGALLIATHKAFSSHLCNQTAATVSRSFDFLPIVGSYSEQCQSAQSVYTSAVTTAVGIATAILLPQIKEGLSKIEVPESVITTIMNAIGNTRKSRGAGRKKRRVTRKTNSKKSRRR